MAVDEAHHVERCVVHAVVDAQAERRGDRHGRRSQSGDDPMLATHVVSAGQYVPERWSTQHEGGAVGADDAVRQVGMTAGDELERERAAGPGHVGVEPAGNPVDVDPRHMRSWWRYGIQVSCRHGHRCHRRNVPDRGRRPLEDRPLSSSICGRRGAARVNASVPILERVTDATDGEVVLVKVNVDENPVSRQAFQVQSIPAVYAMKNGEVVDGFVGAYPEHVIEEFVANLRPSEEERTVASLMAEGDEGAYRAVLELEPGNEDAIVGLAEMLVARGEAEEALAFLARIPETERTRRVAAAARVSTQPTWSPTTTTPGSPTCSTRSRATTKCASSSSTSSS